MKTKRKRGREVYRSVWLVLGSTEDGYTVQDQIIRTRPRVLRFQTIPDGDRPFVLPGRYFWGSCFMDALTSKDTDLQIWQLAPSEKIGTTFTKETEHDE